MYLNQQSEIIIFQFLSCFLYFWHDIRPFFSSIHVALDSLLLSISLEGFCILGYSSTISPKYIGTKYLGLLVLIILAIFFYHCAFFIFAIQKHDFHISLNP